MTRGQAVAIGTVRQTAQGYYEKKLPDGKWKLLHRLVIEEHLGRSLASNEWVVFKNKEADRQDPQVEDLAIRVVTQADRTGEQNEVEPLIETPHPNLPAEKLCPSCGETKPIKKFYIQKNGRPKSFCRRCSNSYWDPKKHAAKKIRDGKVSPHKDEAPNEV